MAREAPWPYLLPMATRVAGRGPARAFLTGALAVALVATGPARAAERADPPAPFRGPAVGDGAAGPSASPPRNPAAVPWRGPRVLDRDPASGRQKRLPVAELLSRPHALLFDTVAFDPLEDGEPDLSSFAREPDRFAEIAAAARRLAVVQFERPPGPAERAALAETGLTPLFYLPRDAYLVRGDAVALARASGLAGVRWVGRYRPGYKLDRELARLAAGRPGKTAIAGEGLDAFRIDALVLLDAGRTIDDLARELSAPLPGIAVEGAIADGAAGVLTLSLPRRGLAIALAEVAALEEVVALEPRGDVRLLNDDAIWIGQSYDRFWRRDYARTATVWKAGLLGEGEIIGIADSGVDPDVCWMIDDANGLPPVSSVPVEGPASGPIPVDLSRRKIVAYNLLGSFQAGATAYDVRSGDPHGTWVAVSAAGDNPSHPASESNPVGPHHDPADGVAPLAKLVVEDLGDEKGELVGLGLPVPIVVDRMFEQMRDAGARVATNSWGVERNQYDTLAFFTDRMAWNHPDFLIVFSAGNGGPDAGSLASPGTAKNVLTVGASDARIQADPDPAKALDPENVAEFSSRGPTLDGRLKPDLVMSGRALATGTSDRGENGLTCTTFEVSGTSFAAPLVAGYAALAREYFRKGYYPSGAARAADGFLPSAALLKAALIAGARNMAGRGGPDYGPCLADSCDLAYGLCFGSFADCDEDADCWACDAKPDLTCATDRDCDLSLLSDDAPSPDQGWGRLHLDDVLFFGGNARGLAVWDVPRDRGVATGESWAAEIYLDARAQELKIALAWPDPPALVASPSYLVNDLDLVVTAPDGTVYRGNAWAARDRDPFTREATAPGVLPASDLDNVEVVRLPSGGAPAGIWRIEVVGESVPGTPFVDGGGRQDFAVVAVGPVSTAGGTLRFLRPQLGCDGVADLEAIDANAGSTLVVTIVTGSGDEETVTLASLGGGRYAGSVPLRSGTALAPGNGQLEVASGDLLTATYQDGNPAHAATATAEALCRQELLAGPPRFSGGCDGDAFLDAAEQGSLELSLSNPGPVDLEGVRATLRSPDPRLFVEPAERSFGDIAVGATGDAGDPFLVSLRDGVAPGETVELELWVRADGWTAPQVVGVPLVLETDEIRTEGSWLEPFDSVGSECYDGDPAPTPGRWYWFDPNRNCATSEPTWNLGLCYGNRQALIPSCTGQLLSTSNKVNHRLVSPQVVTGEAGTTTTLRSVRFRESFHLKMNQDGRSCERTLVEVFTNRDGRTLPSGYYRDRSADGTDLTADLDPGRAAEWVLPPAPDATMLQLLFRVDVADPTGSSSGCTASGGDEIRWRVDDVELRWENVRRGADAGTCVPACSSPSAPPDVTAVAAGDAILVGWGAVPGAGHYDVWRREGASDRFVARVDGGETALLDRPTGSGPFTYAVEAVDASGLCASARIEAAPLTPGACRVPPPVPSGFITIDAEEITCRVELEWEPVVAPCGGPVSYRIYRSADPRFEPGPATLLDETASASFSDAALTTGWDPRGEPLGDGVTYELRAVDLTTGIEGAGVRAMVRPGGPRQGGTWIDDAGDLRPAKMTSDTALDETGAGAGWSRSPLAVHRSGEWSYWSDDDPMGTGRYAPLACFGLAGPEILLDAAASPRLSFYANYSLEHLWDGMVVELSVDGGPYAPIDPIGGYPATFAETLPPPCAGSGGGTGGWINGCDYPPQQGCITGPPDGALSGWQEFEFDLSPWAGRSVRFAVNLSSDCGTDGGAVIDDLSVTGARLPSSCSAGPCWPPPTFAGALAAEEIDPQAASGIRLVWGEVGDWGGGGPGSFEVWRDGERVATLGPAERSFDDVEAEANRDHAYQVLARSGGGCALRSASPALLTARDCGLLDPEAIDAAHLTVDLSPSRDQVILRCEPIPGAGRYRFPWSQDPSLVGTAPEALESGAPEARHGVGQDGLPYYYLVRDAPDPSCP